MFRQDRTNPSTAVSTWNGRRDLPKANPSTAVSAWLNGGLAGGGAFNAYGGIITQYEDSGTTYRVHAFRSTGTFTVTAGSADVDYLIIAGGGGASGAYGGNGSWTISGGAGGGGAGGMLTGTGVTVDTASSPYTITVGTGGFGKVPGLESNGSNSVALGVTATGGGKGPYVGVGGSGGSGGGGGVNNSANAGGSGTTGQGNDGGAGGPGTSPGSSSGQGGKGGGGGGKGGVGEAGNAFANYGGRGGAGATGYGIGSTTPTYAGGGTGAGENTWGISGSGALYGGGGSDSTLDAHWDEVGAGVPNTGGGGGACGRWNYKGGMGGAGIVIIRYAVA